MTDIDVKKLSLPGLRAKWRAELGSEPPPFRSRDLLARALVHRLETAVHGDLRPSLKRRLTDLAAKFAADSGYEPAPRAAPSIGSALVREWNGVRHVVLVTADGFQYLETTYPSLTHVAKAISGAHQSGPRFFGLSSGKLASNAGETS